MKKIRMDPLKDNIKKYNSKLSLTLLFSITIFLILLTVTLIVCAAFFVLYNIKLTDEKIGFLDSTTFIWIMLATSILLGALFSFLFGKVFMKPVDTLINAMNRIASGNFKTRVTFSNSILNKNKAIKELSDSVNTMAEELEKTEILRADFLNNFSHEFKTPIVSIAGFAKLLKSGNLTEEQKAEYIDIIEEESLRLSLMANNVLTLTKIENQTILQDVTSFNLSEQLRNCLLLLENKWTEKNLEIDLDFDEYEICANKDLLKHVWMNLFDNAIKFANQNGVIGADIKKSDGKIAVSVFNSGSRISNEEKTRIFRKFYQADKSHASEGNGLGLSIVKSVVELHKGRVDITSKENFTVFTITLPT